MSRVQLIEEIRRHNPTAGEDFLAGFDDDALDIYLQHLQYGKKPRDVHNYWIRSAETAASMTRQN